MDKISEDFKELAIIEDAIFNINESSFEENMHIIKNGLNKYNYYISRCINKAATFKLSKWPLYYKLIKELNIQKSNITAQFFRDYIMLHQVKEYKPFILGENKTLEEIESVFDKNSSAYAAATNNLSYFTNGNLDKLALTQIYFMPFDNEFIYTEKIGQQFNLLNIAALHGSIDVFNYLLASDFEISSKTTICSLIGGNIDIATRCLEEQWITDSIHVAIASHQNNMLNHLVSNGIAVRVGLSVIFYEFNTYAFANIISSGIVKIDKTMSKFYARNLFNCFRFNLECYANFFLDNNVPIDFLNPSGYSILCSACAYCSTNLIKRLISLNCDVNHQTNDGFCPFSIALSRNRFDVCDILLSNGCTYLNDSANTEKILTKMKIIDNQAGHQYILSKITH